MENDKKGAAVKFPPPLVFLIGMIAAYAVHYFYPITVGRNSLILPIGIVILTFSVCILIYSLVLFIKAKTHIEPWKPTNTIISSGLFAYSRNPIYLAFCILTIGIGTMLNSFWVILSCIPSAVVIFYIAIKKEEAYLGEKFGDEYIQYRQKVRRWL